MDLVRFSNLIHEYFNPAEMRDLCFQLSIGYADLAGEIHTDRVRELTMYCHRHGRTAELLEKCRELRPHADWDSVVRATQNAPPTGQTADFGAPLPQTEAPRVPGMFWMPYPNMWYGPFDGFFILIMPMGGFQVWDPRVGYVPFPDPYRQIQRDVWVRLINTPFNVFVDMVGNVFGQYSP